MNYLVVVKYLMRDTVWKTYEKEFGSLEGARYWAKEMYDGADVAHGEEVTVLLYELKESLN